MEKRPPQQVKVELTEPAAEGTYSNWVMITYGSSEFIIDFGRFLPGLPKAKVYSRIIMTAYQASAQGIGEQRLELRKEVRRDKVVG